MTGKRVSPLPPAHRSGVGVTEDTGSASIFRSTWKWSAVDHGNPDMKTCAQPDTTRPSPATALSALVIAGLAARQ